MYNKFEKSGQKVVNDYIKNNVMVENTNVYKKQHFLW